MVIREGLQTEVGFLEAATWPRVMRKTKVLWLDDLIMATLDFDMAFCGGERILEASGLSLQMRRTFD